MQYSLDRNSQYLPLAAFCPWNQLCWHIFVPICWLPVPLYQAFGLRAEVAGFAKVRSRSGWCCPLSDVRGRHRFLNANLNGSCGLVHCGVCCFCLSTRNQSDASLRRCHTTVFPVGRSSSLFWPIFIFLTDKKIHKHWIFWCICLFCLEPSMLVSKYNRKTDGKLWTSGPNMCVPLSPQQPNCKLWSINIQQRNSLWKSTQQNRPLLTKYALKSTWAKTVFLPILFKFPLLSSAAVAYWIPFTASIAALASFTHKCLKMSMSPCWQRGTFVFSDCLVLPASLVPAPSQEVGAEWHTV